MRCAYVSLLLFLTHTVNAQTTDITLQNGNICRGGSTDLNTLIVAHPQNVPYSRWKEGNTYLNTAGFYCVVSPVSNTTYTLEYCLTENGDTLTKDALVTVWLEPNVTVPADISVCRGTRITLLATATNAQEVMWRNGSTIYSDGEEVLIENRTYSFVATARNDYCTTSSTATWTVEGKAPIVNPEVTWNKSMPPFCIGETIGLHSLLRFFVKDDENNSYPAAYLEGTATWTSNGQPVSDAANYKVPDWASLVATVSAKVAYTSVCDGPKTYTIPPTPVQFIITGTATTASAVCNYRNCPGDPVDIQLSLATGCNDTIQSVNITYAGGSAGCNLNFSTPREHTYRCNPIPTGASYTVALKTVALDTIMNIAPSPVDPPSVSGWPYDICKGDSADFCITTDCDDILSIDWTVTPAGVSKPELQSNGSHSWCYRVKATENATYTAEIKYRSKEQAKDDNITIPLPLAIIPSAFHMYASPEEICKGDSAIIAITSKCDSIVTVDNWNIATPVHVGRSERMMAYKTTVSQNTTIQARVIYYDRSTAMDKSTYVTGQLNVRNDPPKVSPASYNLCRGTADTARVIADACDTIVQVIWKDKKTGAVLSPQPPLNPDYTPWPTERQYILSPDDSITYVAEIEYKRSSETATQTIAVDVFVSVRERPHILKQKTVPVCETDKEVHLNEYVDSALVNMHTVQWLGYPNAIAPNLQDAEEKTYQVQATYSYTCSEMKTDIGEPERLTVLFQTSRKPVFQKPVPSETYCQNSIPLTAVEQFTTYKWILPGNVEINKPDTVYNSPAAGEFNFTLVAENECGVNSTDSKIFLSAVPFVKAAEPVIEACEGSTVTLALSDYERTGIISWMPSGQTEPEPVITVTTPATYIVSVTNLPCPAAYDTIVINAIALPQVEAMDDIDVCENSELTLNVKRLQGGKVTLDWVKAEGNNNFIPVTETTFPVTAPGTYVAIAHNQCTSASSTVEVTMTPLPFVTIRTEITACLGDVIMLIPEIFYGTLAWYKDGQSVDPAVTVVETPTVYTVVASNKCGNSEPASVTVFARPPIVIKPEKMPAFKHNIYYDFRFSAENAVHPVSYDLNGALPAGLIFKTDGSVTGFARLSGGNYYDYPLTITVKDADNCLATGDYVLAPEWSAPNAFLPGSSGFNSIFLAEYELEIYDRRGYLIHKGLGWTGLKADGQRAPAGTYFYKVTIPQNIHNHTTRYFSGYITVLPQ